MTTRRGTNALCYIGGTKLSETNEWSIDIEREKIEAPHTMVCPSNVASMHTKRAGGYFSGSISIAASYDDTDDTPIAAALSDTLQEVLLYPNCDATNNFWIGNFLIQASMTTGVDDYVALDISGEGHGRLQGTHLWTVGVSIIGGIDRIMG